MLRQSYMDLKTSDVFTVNAYYTHRRSRLLFVSPFFTSPEELTRRTCRAFYQLHFRGVPSYLAHFKPSRQRFTARCMNKEVLFVLLDPRFPLYRVF